MSVATSLRYRTHAKINLHLRVVGRRPDGYHEIETILHGITLFDEIEFASTTGGELAVEMVGEEGIDTSLFPALEQNLLHETAARLVALGAVNEGLSITLKKRIPIGAGLGGGSGNAAGALVALREIWHLDWDDRRLLEVAAEIGSDVPYCVSGGTALATSRGEILTKLPVATGMSFVLGLSSEPLPTPEVYASWDEIETPPGPSGAPMALALGAGDVTEVAVLLHNDLEAAAWALRPELRDKKERMAAAGALGSAMSGSGPTIFGIARDADHASAIAARVKPDFDRVLIVSSQSVCVERLA